MKLYVIFDAIIFLKFDTLINLTTNYISCFTVVMNNVINSSPALIYDLKHSATQIANCQLPWMTTVVRAKTITALSQTKFRYKV